MGPDLQLVGARF